MKDPAFLFYTGDFITGTQEMSCEEVGAYLRLLMHQHQHGKIPNDKSRMMRITGIFSIEEFNNVWEIICDKFQPIGNHLVNERMTTETVKRTEYRPKKIAAATLAGLISSSKNLNENQKLKIKKAFIIGDFIELDKDSMKIKIKEWFTNYIDQMVNHKVNYLENEDENENENIIINNIYKTEFSEKEEKTKTILTSAAISMDRWMKISNLDKDQILLKIDEFVEKKFDWEENNWQNESDLKKNFEFWLIKNPKLPYTGFTRWTKEDFFKDVQTVSNGQQISKETLQEFFDHYREPTPTGEMLFQSMKAWDTRSRLKKWLNNKKNYATRT